MHLKFWPTRPLPIGVDVGSTNIRMLQLADAADGLRVEAAAHYELAPDVPAEGPERTAVLVEAFRQLLASAPFRGRQAVVCLPDSVVHFKSVRMPPMPADELRQAIAWEAADRLALNNAPATFQHIIAGDVQQGEGIKQEILLMAAADASLQTLLGVMSEAGLQVRAFEAVPLALARCFARLRRREVDASAVTLMLDVGRGGSRVVILRGHQVAFYRRIEIGGHTIDASAAQQLNITPAQAAELRRGPVAPGAIAQATRAAAQEIAKEIGLCLRYYGVTFRGNRPQNVTLCGGEARDAQFVSMLAEHIEMPVTVAEPLAGVDCSASQVMVDRRGSMPEWAVAVGSAIRSLASSRKTQRGAA